jgi:quinol monooxygenase YgiN
LRGATWNLEPLRVSNQGTEAALAAVKDAGNGLGCKYWTVLNSFSNFEKKAIEIPTTADFLTLQPTFTIKRRSAAEPFLKECVARTKREPGCLYYGWAVSDSKLFCRKAYVNGEAVTAHLENVGPALGALLKSGAVTLDKMELHGPAAEISKAKAKLDAFGCSYWGTYGTWSKFSMLSAEPTA